MKKSRFIMAMALVGALGMGVVGCGSNASDTADDGSAPTESAQVSSEESTEEYPGISGKEYQVGICQLVQHEALDAATKGFKDALIAELGDAVGFDEQNAAGDASTAMTICSNLAAENVDLILANATASLQSAKTATDTIPILGTSITNYGTALDEDAELTVLGGNISGTSDLAPLDQQAEMFTEVLPDAKTIGILYCSGEPNSKFQADEITVYLEEAGYSVSEYTFADSNDVTSVTQQACADCDALYIPTDNTAASCTEAINNVALSAQTPIVAGEEGIMSGCGIVTLSIDYYHLGEQTGQMAAKILTGEADISTMEIQYYDAELNKEYNPEICESLGIEVPDDYVAYEQ